MPERNEGAGSEIPTGRLGQQDLMATQQSSNDASYNPNMYSMPSISN